ncbi:hypothetical protein T265_15548, partial [Opisthorchis viverrini]
MALRTSGSSLDFLKHAYQLGEEDRVHFKVTFDLQGYGTCNQGIQEHLQRLNNSEFADTAAPNTSLSLEDQRALLIAETGAVRSQRTVCFGRVSTAEGFRDKLRPTFVLGVWTEVPKSPVTSA